MRSIVKTAIALGFIAAVAIAGIAPAEAFHIWIGHRHQHYWGGGPYYNYSPGYVSPYYSGPCRPGWTVQSGVCKPYRGW